MALLLPRSFYDDVPTVARAPPFNEHLLRDLGAMGPALAVVRNKADSTAWEDRSGNRVFRATSAGQLQTV